MPTSYSSILGREITNIEPLSNEDLVKLLIHNTSEQIIAVKGALDDTVKGDRDHFRDLIYVSYVRSNVINSIKTTKMLLNSGM